MESEFDIIERYVAVWNESDPEERRQRIRSVWASDGSTCYRLLDARGYDAIEQRVHGSWEKWLRDGRYIFRPKTAAAHHNAIKLEFVLLTVPEGRVEANGLSFLLLDDNGHVQRDYQFNPSADEPNEIVDRYLAMMNEPDPAARQELIAALWAADGTMVRDFITRTGRAAILAESGDAHGVHVAQGRMFCSGRRTHAHHDVVKFTWRLAAHEGEPPTARGTDLLILDADGRIKVDYRFDEAA